MTEWQYDVKAFMYDYTMFITSMCSPKVLDDPEMNATLGLVGEAGEIADLMKKRMFHGHHVPQHWLVKELGDLFFYFTLMLYAQGYTLEEVVAENMRKLNERYPEGFDPERSMNRE